MRSKVLSFIFFFLPIFLSSCEKNNPTESNSIVGGWELLKEQAGRAPVTTYPSGKGNVLRFTKSNYYNFSKGQLLNSGTYAIVTDTTVEAHVCLVLPDNQYRNRIIYDGDENSRKEFYQISNDTLTILSGCFAVDAGISREYVRR